MAKSKTVTDTQIAKQLAAQHGLSQKQAKNLITDYNTTLAKEAKKAGKVRTFLGTFAIKKVPAKKGGQVATNPFTGEKYKTKPKPANTKLKFRPNKTAKELVGGHFR